MTVTTDLSAARPLFGARLVLFADCLLLGVLTFFAALPLLTAFAAVTAACRLLRARIDRDAEVTVGGYLRTLAAVLRSHPGVAVFPLLLALDLVALAAGAPGAPVLVAALGGIAVVALRAAAGWAPDRRWPAVVRAAASATVRDPGGTALLLAAIGVALVLSLLVPLMIVLIPGVLAFAPVAVAGRAR